MRILIVSTFFPPLNSIASLRPYSWAKEWSIAGHDVTVLTIEKVQDESVSLKLPNSEFRLIEVPAPRLFKSLKKGYQQNSTKDQKRPLFLKRWLKRAAYALFSKMRYRFGIFNACRMPDFTDLWIRPALARIKDEECFDLVISTSGPYATHVVAAAIKKRGQAKQWVADYRDSWSSNYIYPGLFPFNWVERVLEKRLLAHADVITTVSDSFTEQYAKRCPCKKVVTIENGFDPEDIVKLPQETIFPDDGKYRIVHTGSIYLGKRNPEPLFAAIASLAQEEGGLELLEPLEILFVGAQNANVTQLIERFSVGRWVKVMGFVSREAALAMQRDAHLLLFLPWNDTAVDGVMTGKLFEYLFSGTPIIAVGSKRAEASQHLILDAGAGWAFYDVDAIKVFLIEKLTHLEKEKCQLDPALLLSYRRDILANKLLETVSSS